MFDLIAGIPIHPLAVHAVVVLGPLAALLAVAYAARPGWRRGLQYPTAGLAVISAILALVATQSGEALQHRVGDPAYDHAEAGDLAAISLYVLAAAVLLVVFVLIRPQVDRADRGRTLAGSVVIGLATLFVAFGVFNAGHSGAKAVWVDRIAGTTPTSHGGGD